MASGGMILDNSRHEKFAQLVASGKEAGPAYVAAGFSQNGADQSAHRLLNKPAIQARVRELQSEISTQLKDSTIRDVNARVEALHERWERVKTQLARYEPLAEEHPKLYLGLLRELRAIEEQAAKQLGQWQEKSADVNLAAQLNLTVTFVKPDGCAVSREA
jgi:hypothetical protein